MIVSSVSTEAFDFFSQAEMSESGGTSWGDLWDDLCEVSDCVSGTGTKGLVLPFCDSCAVFPFFHGDGGL